MTHSYENPAPDVVSTDHRGTRRLSYDECLQRVHEAAVGRIAFSTDGEIVILPVNPLVDNTTILFRTSWGAKFLAAEQAERVAFEVDGFDASTETGWSVMVQGTLSVVDDNDECERLDRIASPSWLPEADEIFWVAIRPHNISGRELVPQASTGDATD